MQPFHKVIFIAYLPLTEKFRKDFYLDQLIEAGFKTEYWNLGSLFYDDLKLHDEVFNEKVLHITSYKQLEEKIKACKTNSLFVFNITYYGKVYKIFRLFAKHNCITAAFARGTLPYPTAGYSLAKRFFLKFKALKNFRYLQETILNQSAIGARRLKLIKPYNFVFYAGAKGVSTIGYGYELGLEKSKLIPVNSFDYDAYLLLKENSCRQVPQRYCVFLDGYFPYHPDFKLLNLPQLDPDEYYTAVNNFFSWIENTYKLEVVIAAHPKSNYDDKTSYGKRMVIKNRTAELVKYAEFVLSHVSTSISFAILFKKPLLFIYTNAIKEIYPFTHYQLVIHFAKLLGACCININEEIDNVHVVPVNADAYEAYKYNYLTSPQSEHKLSKDIFINGLKSMQPERSESVKTH